MQIIWIQLNSFKDSNLILEIFNWVYKNKQRWKELLDLNNNTKSHLTVC